MIMMTATQTLAFAAANGIAVNTVKVFRNGDLLVAVEIEGKVTKMRVPKHMALRLDGLP